jgi:glutaryl-CoA dehydrogenase
MTTTKPPLSHGLANALATDYFFLREQLSEPQLAVLQRVRAFVEDEVLPVINDY